LKRVLRQNQFAYYTGVFEDQRELGSMRADRERGTARKARREAPRIAVKKPAKDLLFVRCRSG
jgi:hypothetical protein